MSPRAPRRPRESLLSAASLAGIRPMNRASFLAYLQQCLIPFPHQSDLTIYGKDVMDLTVLGLRSI